MLPWKIDETRQIPRVILVFSVCSNIISSQLKSNISCSIIANILYQIYESHFDHVVINYYAPNFEKLTGHIAFGACVGLYLL